MALQILQQRNALFEPLQIVGHRAVFASKDERRRKPAVFPGKDGGRRQFLKPQRPEPREKWKYGVPAQRQRIMNEDPGSVKAGAYGEHRPAQTRKRRLRRVQSTEPPAQRGGIGYAIGIFDRGRRGFPATALYEIAAQRLAACDQAVMTVRWREWRQEGKRLSASAAETATNPDPIMVFIMSLFASATVTDDGILLTNRVPAQDDLRAQLGPIGFGVALGRGK